MILDTFLNLPLALDRVKDRAAILSPEQDSYIEELLSVSAATTGESVVVYRPYYVAAYILEQDISKQQISSAGDVDFTQLVTVIASLRSLQLSFDLANSLIIPPGMEVPSAGELPTTKGVASSTTAFRNSLVF